MSKLIINRYRSTEHAETGFVAQGKYRLKSIDQSLTLLGDFWVGWGFDGLIRQVKDALEDFFITENLEKLKDSLKPKNEENYNLAYWEKISHNMGFIYKSKTINTECYYYSPKLIQHWRGSNHWTDSQLNIIGGLKRYLSKNSEYNPAREVIKMVEKFHDLAYNLKNTTYRGMTTFQTIKKAFNGLYPVIDCAVFLLGAKHTWTNTEIKAINYFIKKGHRDLRWDSENNKFIFMQPTKDEYKTLYYKYIRHIGSYDLNASDPDMVDWDYRQISV